METKEALYLQRQKCAQQVEASWLSLGYAAGGWLLLVGFYDRVMHLFWHQSMLAVWLPDVLPAWLPDWLFM